MKRDYFRSFLAKAFTRGEKANPLFPAQKMPSWKRALLGFSLFTLIFGGSYLLFRFATLEKFYINEVRMDGVSMLPEDNLLTSLETYLDNQKLIIFSLRHIWFFKPEPLKEALEYQFPLEVTGMILEGQTLSVNILEDVLMVAIKNNGTWNLVNLDGSVLRPLTPEEVPIFDATEVPPGIPFDRMPKVEIQAAHNPGTQVLLPKERLEAILEFDRGIRAAGLTPHRYILRNEDEDWARVLTKEKHYDILVDLQKPIDAQLLMLKTVLHEYTDKDTELSYIDVRFGNHVYIK